jgi:hypothetical protein
MLAGAVGMVVYAAAAIPMLRRMRSAHGAFAAMGAWLGAAAIVAIPLLAA